MPLTKDLPSFKLSEFRHPEIIDQEAADFLQSVRELYGSPMTITSDGRTPEENAAAPGSSPTSWHLRGRAFDIRAPQTADGWFKLVNALLIAIAFWKRNTSNNCSLELELCPPKGEEPHIHFALKNDGTPNVLIFG